MPRIITKTKRGDTIIEVMLAFAIFCFVAIITVASMGAGLNSIEGSLELTTARNELNAQAEALRFIHSSYISELALPSCDTSSDVTTKCQQYKGLWNEIISQARYSSASASLDAMTMEYPLLTCGEAYKFDNNNDNSLFKNGAFVINTRLLLARNNTYGSLIGYSLDDAIIRPSTLTNRNLFYPATLNARIVYSTFTGRDYGVDGGVNSTQTMNSPDNYTYVARVEGIWVIAVRGPNISGTDRPRYYDFYIQTCWNGPNSKTPTSLDTVVRLYNPDKDYS